MATARARQTSPSGSPARRVRGSLAKRVRAAASVAFFLPPPAPYARQATPSSSLTSHSCAREEAPSSSKQPGRNAAARQTSPRATSLPFARARQQVIARETNPSSSSLARRASERERECELTRDAHGRQTSPRAAAWRSPDESRAAAQPDLWPVLTRRIRAAAPRRGRLDPFGAASRSLSLSSLSQSGQETSPDANGGLSRPTRWQTVRQIQTARQTNRQTDCVEEGTAAYGLLRSAARSAEQPAAQLPRSLLFSLPLSHWLISRAALCRAKRRRRRSSRAAVL